MLRPLPARRGLRVMLHMPGMRDQAEFLRLVQMSRSFHRGWTSPPSTPGAFARYRAACRRPDHAGLLIRRKPDGALVGAIQISQIARGLFQSAYLGFWIGAPYARQGLMYEALGLTLHFAFRQLRLHRLEANVQPTNVASLALVRRLGFRREGYSPRYLKIGGRWRDHERWALLTEEWRPARHGDA